ncbi:hypothetical protein CC1G_14594 [Coprinopsis cinerea okayama7|uniref:Nucleic acid-binding protein n=1 Tax=Coprinopsis cinerea (strain Okayama-7 / 130 / ATCC MYA-4618 / FGSC 9003) TaxID=240176 RepID=D6RMG8_COPC7|nr:hypothetical protein CC1G_14594 [Coprinopsis cinerea okayama7\|eukprot:XP_002911163.1 hypothetical protein CC1G_14594 [Coprinopsis cinerea okayama7\
MLSALRSSFSRSSSRRTFTTSAVRRHDLAKLTLIGTLVRDPEPRVTKSEKEYVMYTVATQNYPPPPPDANGERHTASNFHRVLCFNEGASRYLKTLRKGSRVYVEANYEIREPEPGAEPSSPHGQRQIFLRHEMIRLLNAPRGERHPNEESSEQL